MKSFPNYFFKTKYDDILNRISEVDPVGYATSRNFINGAVSQLSPYISRGVVSTKHVLEHILSIGQNFSHIEKFVQELAWRDYWQQVWIAKGSSINSDLKHPQQGVANKAIPVSIVKASTGINAIDLGINELYKSGYMHNHIRMYTASLTCNVAGSHWLSPARWMYYHLLDGDWASNALSWQWVAGCNAKKKYIANQDNINKYCHTHQHNTFLDVSYEELGNLTKPDIFDDTTELSLATQLYRFAENQTDIQIDKSLPTLIYNYYNLDPLWHQSKSANRILLLEPSTFEQYPVADRNIQFILELAKNIQGIQVYTGEFAMLKSKLGNSLIHYKEHPLNQHYQGIEEARDWMFSVTGYYPSFFAFWKRCQKEMKTW